MRYTLFVYLMLVPSVLLAQKYHEPAEIMKRMSDSKITYELGTLDPVETEIVKTPARLDYGLFLKHLPGGGFAMASFDAEYGENQAYVVNLQKAEQAYTQDSLPMAREYYLKALAAVPNQSQIMTYIGQTYEHVKDYPNAIAWYRRAIDTNYYDYNAHWFLGDNLVVTGHLDEGLSELLIAGVLNRTHDMISRSTRTSLAIAKRSFDDWTFTPRYDIKKLSDTKVSVKYDLNHPEWMLYAMCKALWGYEPGYRDSMLQNSQEIPQVVEEKECVINVLAGIENSGKNVSDAALRAAREALDARMFNEFIIYEVILPAHPEFVFHLSKPFIQSLPAYILRFRTQPL